MERDDERRPSGSPGWGRKGPAWTSRDAGVRSDPPGDDFKSLLPTLVPPKGGGAIRGIGETFSTNLSTGTVGLTVPIATSPGRGGFELGLALSYDTGAGSGPFGIGWGLSVPAVTRRTDQGLPRYLDAEESDVFVLAGAQDLVPARVADGGSTRRDAFERVVDGTRFRVQRYRPRVEAAFARIERWTAPATGDSHWRVVSRDNVTSVLRDDARTMSKHTRTGAEAVRDFRRGREMHVFNEGVDLEPVRRARILLGTTPRRSTQTTADTCCPMVRGKHLPR